MIAGTLAKLEEPADHLLESACAGSGGLPALEVEDTQETLDGRRVQNGLAADRVKEPAEDVFVTERGDGVTIDSEPSERRVEVSTSWIAEPEGSGLLCAASVPGDGDFAFPFGLMGAQLDTLPQRIEVDVEALKERWAEEDALRETTMVGDGADGDSTSIDYGPAASSHSPASLGLGFEVSVDFGIVEGVVWRSGYVALYDVGLEERFVRFVLDELWAHCYVPEDDEDVPGDQQTLGEAADGADEDDQTDSDSLGISDAVDEAVRKVEETGRPPRTVADGVADDRGFGHEKREILVDRVLERVGGGDA